MDAMLIIATILFVAQIVAWVVLPATRKSTVTSVELGSIGDEIRHPVAVSQ